jgi:hypothetical protein
MGLLLASCYSWEEVRPDALPGLNDSYEVQVGTTSEWSSSGTRTQAVMERSVRHVLRPDGTTVEIEGEFDARVTRRSTGETLEFDYPVIASITDLELVLQGSNRASTPFHLTSIERVEVSQPDGALTALAWFGGGLLISGVAAGALAILFVATAR